MEPRPGPRRRLVESASVERALIAGSDLEKAPGGTAATDAAYAAVTASLVEQARSYQATPDFGRFGAGPVAADEGGFSGMTFAGWMIGGLGMQAAVSGTSELTLGGSVETATRDWSLTSTEKGMTGSVHVKGTINPCPDANGEFSAKLTLDTSGEGDSGTGGAASTVDVALSGTVDDNAAAGGSPTGGTITGTLSHGASLDPAAAPVKADATFSYIAPDKEDERATVTLESRSKRGVGKAKIDFDTVVVRGYAIGQTVGPILYSAVNCGSAAGPWVITYELQGLPGMGGGGVIELTFPK